MIYKICRTGNITELERLKEAGLLWYLTTSNYAGLNLLASNGHLDALKWVINSSGLALNPTHAGITLVLHAAKSNQMEVLKWIVEESGFHPDCREVALWLKIWKFNEDVTTYLNSVRNAQEESSVMHWRRKPKPRLSL